ncbi:MAG: hypothetical protein E3K32_06920 [wastewater metagenome]|nr:hypothetical protein [Candidatus Loosdrechtia aerotolerans]
MFNEVKELNKKTTIKLALFSLTAIGVVVFVFFITLTRPNHSHYCAKCHSTITFNTTCKALSGDIACIDCHTNTNKGIPVMAVEIRNEHCTSEPCHPLSTLSAKASLYKDIKPFQHKTHVSEVTKDFKLKCTTCHTSLRGKKHFETDERACNICHFINTQKRNSKSDCTLCHGHIEKTKEIYGKIFQHNIYEENEKVLCSDCHFQSVQGDGEVDKKNCLQCHSNLTGKSQGASDLHNIHIDRHKIACTSCHASIKHGRTQTRNTIYRSNNPEFNGGNSNVQNLIMMGEGGKGITGKPDPMYLATLDCSACHKDKQFSTHVTPEVCTNCHTKGFDKVLSEQMHFIASRMQMLKTLLIKEKRQNSAGNSILWEAEANYNLIREDGSLGAHNIKYIKDLLHYSIKNVKHISKERQNSTFYYDKQKIKSGVSFQKYQYPTNSCTDRCHVNYMAYRTIYQGNVFQHKSHSPDKGLECSQCHNNDPIDRETHGRLTIQNKDCTACHHKRMDTILIPLLSKDNKNFGESFLFPNYTVLKRILKEPVLERQLLNENDCLKCHADVRDYINGDLKGAVPKTPDWMYRAVSCIDCHEFGPDGYSLRAVREYCVKCHNPDYGLLYDAWQEILNKEVKRLYKNDVRRDIQDLLRLIQSYGMHNFRLSKILLKSVKQMVEKEEIN